MDLDNIGKSIAPTLRRGQFIRFEGVGIRLQSDGGIGVAEPFRNSWNRYALTEQLTGMTVPERIQTDVRQPAFAVISATLELIWPGL